MSQSITTIEDAPRQAAHHELASQPQAMPEASPLAVFDRAAEIVKLMSERCSGPAFISTISGRKYPQVTWWTSVGAALGLTTVEVSNVRQDRPGSEVVYEATIEILHGDRVIGRGSAICSSREKRWGRAEEFAIRSMAATRATGKAYRLSCSWIATLAGLEATLDEEAKAMPVAASDADLPDNLEELFLAACAHNESLRSTSMEHFWSVTVQSWATKAGRVADREFVAELIEMDKVRSAAATTETETD